MKRVFYHLPDSAERVAAFILCEEGRMALLFVPPLANIRGATITIAERIRNETFEDSVSSSFPLKNWGAAATLAIFLLFVVKDDLIDHPPKPER